MQSNQLSVRNIQLPSLGIGTWAWGDNLFWGYGSNYGETDVQQAFNAAVEAGATFFDTAEVYGLPAFLTKSAIAKQRTFTGSGFDQCDCGFP